MPFDQIVEALHPRRSLSRMPIYQVMFALQNTLLQAVGLPDRASPRQGVHSGTAKYELIITMSETDQKLAAREYNTDLFDADTMSHLLIHFKNLLEAVVANPETRVADLPLLTGDERPTMCPPTTAFKASSRTPTRTAASTKPNTPPSAKWERTS